MTTIILSGGGIYGLCHIGFLRYLQEHGLLGACHTIVASSIGSVVGFLSCLYEPEEMLTIFESIDNTCFRMETRKELEKAYGYDSAIGFMEILSNAIRNRGLSSDITFSILEKEFNKRLVVTGSNVSTGNPTYFSETTHPNMKILDALRISISLPVLFTPVKLDDDLYIDGSAFDNYPSEYATKIHRGNRGVFGMHLEPPDGYTTDTFMDYCMGILMGCMKRQRGQELKGETVKVETVKVKAKHVDPADPLDFSLSLQDRMRLYRVGYDESAKCLRL